MTGYLTEQQQIEQIKKWWKKHGLTIIIFFLIALLSGMGWHFWLRHHEIKLERGSTHYEELLSAVINGDNAVAMKEANLLKNNYEHTPYAALAILMIARNDVYQNNYAEAEKQLEWVTMHGPETSLRQIARLRLARLYIQDNQAQKALDILQKIDNKVYGPLIDEEIGDAYFAMHQIDQARTIYQRALNSVSGYAVMRPVLEMKLDDLASGVNA